MEKWSNWSGSLQFRPTSIETPESEEEIARIVKNALSQKRKVRVVGAGHSSSPLVATRDVLLSLKHFTGVEGPCQKASEATVLGGTTVHEAGKGLYAHGLAMHNTGDVDVQTLAGAISTGTHGSGNELQNLSSMLLGGTMVTGTGEILEVGPTDVGRLNALQVSLGTMGVFVKMRVKTLPAFELHRTEWCVKVDDCMANLEQLINENRNLDFYWYPRNDLCKVRIMKVPGKGTATLPYGKLVFEKEGPGHEILPRERSLKFDEMEYALAAENGPACFQEVRKVIKAKFRATVAWRLLYRIVEKDDAFLSPAHGRKTVTISLHHNAGLPFWQYFKAIEPIFRAYGGRPHWGKKHTLKAPELKKLYPEWESFHHWRNKFDPERVFLSPHMQTLLFDDC